MTDFDFYHEKDYTMLAKVTERLKETAGITLKNLIIFWEFLERSINLAENEYNKVGFNEKYNDYSWAHFSLGIFYKALDHYENKNPYFNYMLYSYVIRLHTRKGFQAVMDYFKEKESKRNEILSGNRPRR